MDLTKLATRLIARHGRAVTLQRRTPDATDAGGGTTWTWTDHPATAANGRYDDELKAKAGGLIAAGDVRFFIAADAPIRPAPQDRVIAEGEVFRVVSVAALGTAGTAHLFEVQGRPDA